MCWRVCVCVSDRERECANVYECVCVCESVCESVCECVCVCLCVSVLGCGCSLFELVHSKCIFIHILDGTNDVLPYSQHALLRPNSESFSS